MASDAEQWTAWLDEHVASLVLLARQWVPVRADAEDVVQEAFIRFWRSRRRVTEPAGFFYACVKNVAIDWQRNRQRQARREVAVARKESATLFVRPLEQSERRIAIEGALRGLPINQREVLVMRIWGGLSFSQIATALEISDNTVKSRYRYALAKLSEQLAEELIP